MVPDRDGSPKLGDTGRTLGLRPGYPDEGIDPDIEADADGMVRPDFGGISVALPPLKNLRPHRRPPKHGGTDKKVEVYELETDGLPEELQYRVDPFGPKVHAFIEPAYKMSYLEYKQALYATRELWHIVR